MRRKAKLHSSTEIVTLGTNLVGAFQTALITTATVEQSKNQAANTESEVLNQFSTYNRQNGIYVSPTDIPVTQQESLAHVSVDAHLQKAQAIDIEHYGNQQLLELQASTNSQYIGQEIKLTLDDKKRHAIHSCRQDQITKQYFYGANTSQSVRGTIIAIDLLANYIVIKPRIGRRLIARDIPLYLVEIVDTVTFRPLVHIQVIA